MQAIHAVDIWITTEKKKLEQSSHRVLQVIILTPRPRKSCKQPAVWDSDLRCIFLNSARLHVPLQTGHLQLS